MSGLLKLKSILSVAIVGTCLYLWTHVGAVPVELLAWGSLIVGSLYGGKERGADGPREIRRV